MPVSETLSSLNRAMSQSSSNLSKSKANGAVEDRTHFAVYTAGENIDTIEVKSSTPGLGENKFNFEKSNNIFDIAIQGMGLLSVQGVSGEIRYISSGSFTYKENGSISTLNGQNLRGYKYDENGDLNRTSLEAVSITNVFSPAKVTTTVDFSAAFNSNKKQVDGAGQKFSLTGGRNSTTKDKDLIIPGADEKFGDLIQGTKIKLKVANNEAKEFVFGGIGVSNSVKVGDGIFGAKDYNKSFNIISTAPVNQSQIQENTGIEVSINGGTAKQILASNNQRGAGYFNSLDTLKSALEAAGLRVRIENGRIYYSGANASDRVQISNYNGSIAKEVLGLESIEASADVRFASLAELEKSIKTEGVQRGFTASISDNKKEVSIRASSALESITMEVTALDAKKKIDLAVVGRSYDGDGDIKARTSVTITAPDHNLTVGDWIEITDSTNVGVPDGKYMVTARTDDTFRINMQHDVAVANAAAVGAQINAANFAGVASWSKIAGKSESSAIGIAVATQLTHNGGNLQITLNGGHGILNNDIVYISGIGGVVTANGGANQFDVPDGYYQVTVNMGAADVLIITPVTFVGGGGVDPNHPSEADLRDKIRITKVQTGNAVPYSPQILTTGAAGSSEIKLYLDSKTTYTQGDTIKISGLAMGAAVVDGVTINDGEYTIQNVQLTADGSRALVTINGTGAAMAGNQATLYAADFANFKIDHFSRFNEASKLAQKSKNDLTPTYDPGNVDLSISNNKYVASTVASNIIAYTPLGDKLTLELLGAKVSETQWAFEVRAPMGVKTTRVDNLISSFYINFGAKGDANDLSKTITIDSDSGTFDITLNLTSISQTNLGTSDSYVRKNDNDGRSAGSLKSLDFDKGVVYGDFSNGERLPLYAIPIVKPVRGGFDDIFVADGFGYRLAASENKIQICLSGENGAGVLIGGVTATSSIDNTQQIIDLQSLSQISNMVATSYRIQSQTDEKVVNQITA